MLRHGLLVVLISASSSLPPCRRATPSGVARCARFVAAWNSAELGRMPYSPSTQRAISGSRALPWSVKAFPVKPLPFSLSYAAARTDLADESRATSVAVMPRLRARSHATLSVECATMRDRCSADWAAGAFPANWPAWGYCPACPHVTGACRPPRRSRCTGVARRMAEPAGHGKSSSVSVTRPFSPVGAATTSAPLVRRSLLRWSSALTAVRAPARLAENSQDPMTQ